MAVPSQVSVPRYVGAAFVAQFSTSLAAGLLSPSMLSGDVGTVVAAIGTDTARLHAVIVLQLLTTVGIIALTALLYVALCDTIRWVATVAFALWLAEATVLVLSMLSLYALLDLVAMSVGSGSALSAPDASIGQVALGVHEHAADIAMLFSSAGALLWYWLFLRTRFVPRWLSIWGLASVVLVCIATLILVWDRGLQPPIVLYVAYVPYELVVGIWLLVKGSPGRPEDPDATRPHQLPLAEQPAPEAVDVRPEAVSQRRPIDVPATHDPVVASSGYPVDLEHRVLLSDGRDVFIRPVRVTDAEEMRRALADADVETLHARFLGAPPRGEAAIHRLVDLDFVHRLALAAFAPDGHGVGIARYGCETGSRSAEVAVVVDPGWRRVGLGSQLLRELGEAAARRNINRFTALALADNAPVLALLRASGLPFTLVIENATSRIDITLPDAGIDGDRRSAP